MPRWDPNRPAPIERTGRPPRELSRLTSKPAAVVRQVQELMANVAESHPNLTCPEQREAELEEVLRTLGICYETRTENLGDVTHAPELARVHLDGKRGGTRRHRYRAAGGSV